MKLPRVELPADCEWPDLDVASQNDFNFLRAVVGEVTPPSEMASRWIDAHEGAMDVCIEASVMMLQFRMEPLYKGQRGKGWRTPDAVVMEYIDKLDDKVGAYSAMSEITTWLAMHDTRYWGVEDSDREWYCSYCDSKSSAIGKGAKPKGEFTKYAWKCDYHAQPKGERDADV